MSLEVEEFGDLTKNQCVLLLSAVCGTARYLYTRFLHENRKQLKVYRALRKGVPQFSTDFLEFQNEPEELETFAKLVKNIIYDMGFRPLIPTIIA